MPLVRRPTHQASSPSPEAAAVLKALVSSNVDERWTAARAASGVAGAVPALAAALRTENDARVREALFTSLARIGTTESAEEALFLLRSDSATLRTGALDALRLMTSAVREILPRLLKDEDVDVRILTCELARGLPTEEATNVLSSLLASERNVNVCGAAIDVLAEVGGPGALPILTECSQRFRDTPFLSFAIQVAIDRIRSTAQPPRG